MLLRGVAMVTMATDFKDVKNPNCDTVTAITWARNNIFSQTFHLNDHHDPLYQPDTPTHFP